MPAVKDVGEGCGRTACPGSMRRREETGTSRARTCRTVLAPPADPTATASKHQTSPFGVWALQWG
jgi:hypothetical protein